MNVQIPLDKYCNIYLIKEKSNLYKKRDSILLMIFCIYIYILYTSIIYFIILHNNQTYQSIDLVLITKLLKRERSLEK